jgi:hypothetical protein
MSLPNTIRRLSATLFCFLTAVAGCNRPGMPFGRDSSAPTADRLVAAYEDLRPAKFQIIADFETPIQGSLFRLEPQRGLGGVEISTQQARPETGVGALRMTLTDSWQHVVAEDRAESEWALPRDWTPYHLLIFSVYSPRPLSGFLFSVRSGTDIPLAYTHPRTSLAQGWNLIRIDLGNLANQVNLADVREMRFWCDPLESPVDLYLDDLVLVNNVKQLFGPTELTPGDLYARSEGRRLVVGAAERFELVFSQGLISQWFDLSSDPAKTRSLTGGLVLGAAPVVPPQSSDPAAWIEEVLAQMRPGPGLEAVQEMVDASPAQIVVRCQWHPGSGLDPAGEQPPVRQWLYTIRRDGLVYIECTGTTGEVDVITTAVSFCLDGDAGFQPTVVARSAEAAPGGAHDPYALFSREERGRADLLVVPFGQVIGQMLRRPDDPRLCVLWRLPPGDTRFSFAAMMRVWPTDIDSAAQAAPMAADYRHPTPLLVDVGSLVRTDPGDFDGDGFSEGRGYYVLQLDNKAADVRISGRRYLRFSPAFKLVNARDRDVWVYVDGKQIETYRDREGDILFEVKGMISNEALVEVRSRVREAQ